MEIEVGKISGVGEFEFMEKVVGKGDDAEKIRVYLRWGEEGEAKAFLVERKNTVEVRCDRKLAGVLREKYESVMESRYFGRGGIEIVNSGQLSQTELEDLIRLSYNLS